MSDQVLVVVPVSQVLDGDSFTADIVFRDAESQTEMAPTTVQYRIDDVTSTTPVKIQDWTTITAGAAVSVVLSSTYNALQTASDQVEIRQLTVAGDRGLVTQCCGQAKWKVLNRNLGA